MKAVLQKSINDCGLACLAIIASHFKRPVELETIASLLPLKDWQDGASMKQLNELARQMGFKTEAVKCGAGSLHKLPLPGIAHFASNHYVVVSGINDKHVSLLDPRFGRAMLSRKEFEELCSGLFLTFSDMDAEKENLQSARLLHRQLLARDPWVHAYRQIFTRELVQLLPFASLYGCAIILSLTIWIYWAIHWPSLRPAAIITHGSLTLGLLLFRLIFLEHYLLKRYASLARAVGEKCLHQSHNFYQYAGSYKLLDRYRWVVEFIYHQRYAILSGLQIVSSLLLAGILTLLFRDWWATLFCAAFGLAMALETKGNLFALEQSESRYYQRMLVQQMLDSYANGQPKTGPTTPAANGIVNFRNHHWWLPALSSYLPHAVMLAALAWSIREYSSSMQPLRLFWLVTLCACFVSWQFVKGQLSGFTAIASGLQQLSFMSFMKQLSDAAGLREAMGKE